MKTRTSRATRCVAGDRSTAKAQSDDTAPARPKRLVAARPSGALGAAALLALAPLRASLASGVFDGGEVSLVASRTWVAPGPVPGLNWGGDTLPVAADSLFFSECGDGAVDLQAAVHSHVSIEFARWVSYDLHGGAFDLPAGTSIKVADSVGSTYGSSYFSDGNTIRAGLSLNGPTTIAFTSLTSGRLRLAGPVGGAGPITLTAPAGSVDSRSVYFDDPNAGFAGEIFINSFTAARLLDSGRTGAGMIHLDGGDLDILSDAAAGEVVSNPVMASSGRIRADHNYTASPLPPYLPGIVHALGPIAIDSPTAPGGPASISVTADDGYSFSTPALKLANSAAIPAGSRTVDVRNGRRFDGYAGGVRLTSLNRLEEQKVTVTVGAPGLAGPALFDIDPVTLLGIPTVKTGSGVLYITGDNQVTSTGAKSVLEGVIRFDSPISYGTTTGMVGGPPVAVTLSGGPGPVSSGMGVAYPTGIPANLLTTGATPGQSGAFDVDLPGNPFAVVLPKVNTAGMLTALRLGSSGAGVQTGPVTPYTTPGGGSSFYYLGGGGGVLDLATSLAAGPGATTTVEMGTTGTLLPGRVNIVAPIMPIPGSVLIKAGTLGALPPGVIAATSGTSLGAYSTSIDFGSAYTGAPAATPYNGPGQLILDDAAAYFYGPGGDFGGAGLVLDGGAVGWDGPVFVAAVPGTYGATKSSLLYQSASLAAAPVATNLLHLGGEDSAGTMFVGFAITDSPFARVAVMKSGVDSVLDLTAGFAHSYTGGMGIIGGEVKINAPARLGSAATRVVTIGDGAKLSFVPPPGAVVPYRALLRVANGPDRRSSIVNVDPGVLATVTGLPALGVAVEASATGSVLEKQGMGVLELHSTVIHPTASAANTYGIKATGGVVSLNQLPGTVTPENGQAVFAGGTLRLIGAPNPAFLPIPAAIQFHPNYGFGAISSYAGTASKLELGDQAFFRVTGGQSGDWMGRVDVVMGNNSVFKVATDAAGGNTRGTGAMTFSGRGFVQFTPVPGGFILFPRDGAFTLGLDDRATFSGAPDANMNGNVLFNSVVGTTCFIDGAVVDNAPTAFAAEWTIGGTGLTSWTGVVVKGSTEAIPGSGGPFTSGTVTFDRCVGAPVIVAPGARLQIDAGVVNAGNTGDPFTASFGGPSVDVTNNSNGPGLGVPPARGFNVTAGSKAVGNLTVSGFVAAAPAVPAGRTAVYPAAKLTANHVRQNRLDIGAGGTVTIRTSGAPAATSYIATLDIAGGLVPTGALDLNDNDLIVTATPMATIEAQVRNARNNGLWNKPGITSTAARVQPGSNTGLGVINGAEYTMVGGAGVFSGISYAATDVLVKYTWNGDANFDGRITFDDYVRIDTGFNTGRTGWVNGDFNYSGVVNFDDYVLIDIAFNTQSGTLGRAIRYLDGTDRSPRGVAGEPATQWVIEHFEQFGAPYAQHFLAAVPEPCGAVAGMLLSVAAAARRVRRTRCSS